MEKTTHKKRFDSVLARVMLVIIILATLFSLYMTIKLVYSGFTFR